MAVLNWGLLSKKACHIIWYRDCWMIDWVVQRLRFLQVSLAIGKKCKQWSFPNKQKNSSMIVCKKPGGGGLGQLLDSHDVILPRWQRKCSRVRPVMGAVPLALQLWRRLRWFVMRIMKRHPWNLTFLPDESRGPTVPRSLSILKVQTAESGAAKARLKGLEVAHVKYQTYVAAISCKPQKSSINSRWRTTRHFTCCLALPVQCLGASLAQDLPGFSEPQPATCRFAKASGRRWWTDEDVFEEKACKNRDSTAVCRNSISSSHWWLSVIHAAVTCQKTKDSLKDP